jgi:hypothetical protein
MERARVPTSRETGSHSGYVGEAVVIYCRVLLRSEIVSDTNGTELGRVWDIFSTV